MQWKFKSSVLGRVGKKGLWEGGGGIVGWGREEGRIETFQTRELT